MAKKKELNKEAAHVVRALKIALGLSKEADVVTNNGHMIACTPVGTLFVPCTFELTCAVQAIDLYNALNGCDAVMAISERANEVVVSWGRRRATLKTKPKVSVYVQPIDHAVGVLPPEFTHTLRDVIKDLTASINAYSPFVKFTNGAAFWTNGEMASMITTQAYMPDIIVYIKDLKSALSYQEKDDDKQDILINGVGGSHHTVTFHYSDGVAIQIPQVDQSTVKYPAVEKLFAADLYDATYQLTTEHIDAIEYVAKLADDVVYIQPTHIGTSQNPAVGTAVAVDDLPIDLVFMSKLIKLGAFAKAQALIKPTNPQSNVAFYTYRPNVTFCFSKFKVATAQ